MGHIVTQECLKTEEHLYLGLCITYMLRLTGAYLLTVSVVELEESSSVGTKVPMLVSLNGCSTILCW